MKRVFGNRFWNANADEIEAFGDFLYFSCTTGNNMQTLGEEYTDLFIATKDGEVPSKTRRWALVVLEALAKPVGKRLRNASRNAVSGDNGGVGVVGTTIGDEKTKKRTKANVGKEFYKRQFLKAYAWVFGHAPHSATVGNRALKLVNDRGGFGPMTQLMLFYAFGRYVSWTNWATGVGRVFVNPNPGEERAQYSLLSKLIAVQLGFAAYNEALRRYKTYLSVKFAREQPKIAEEFGFFEADGVTKLKLDLDGIESSDTMINKSKNPVSVMDDAVAMLPRFSPNGDDDVDDEVVKRFTWFDIPCPLCLNPTKFPTALKCGHCLCWTCAVECCQQKPECPMCRAPCKPQELICLANP